MQFQGQTLLIISSFLKTKTVLEETLEDITIAMSTVYVDDQTSI